MITLIIMAWVSCIYLPAVIHYDTHFLLTIITHVGGSDRTNYISPSNILEPVLKLAALPSDTIYSNSLPLPSLTFYFSAPK